MRHSISFYISSAAVLVMLGVGCGPRDRKGQNLPAEGAKGVPQWVTKGSGAFKDGGKGNVFYGVGAVSGVSNYSLLRRSAESQARVEIGRVFDSYVRGLAKSYARSVSNFDAAQEEQLVQDATKSHTDVTLKGIQIIEHYFDRPTKTMFACATMDLGVFKDAIIKAEALNEEFREHVKANGDQAFGEVGK